MANVLTIDRARNWLLERDEPVTALDVTSADFDGDGWADLASVVSEDGLNQLLVLRNQAGNGFAAPAAVDTVSSVSNLAVGDVNADGNPDVATAGGRLAFVTGPNTVRLHLGDGQGGFTDGRTVTVGDNPTDLALADMNGDGAADLISAHESGDSVGVRLSDGSGGFGALTTTSLPDAVYALRALDLNGDGVRDVAALTRPAFDDPAALIPLLGDGTGALDPATGQQAGVPANPTALAAGDFNGDGAPDFAVSHPAADGPDAVAIRLNDGSGGFTAAPTASAGWDVRDVSVADLDRDGRDDILAVNRGSQDATLLLGQGDGTFAARESAAINGDSEQPVSIAAIDLNGDGFPEPAVGNDALDGSIGVLDNHSGAGLPRVTAELAWTASLGSAQRDTVTDIAVDGAGNVAVTGYQDERGGGALDAPFIARYSSDGEQLWRTTLPEGVQNTNAAAVGGDDGAIYVAGSVRGEFGDLTPHLNAQLGDAQPGIQDLYLQKLTPEGSVAWTRQFGSDDLDSDAHLAAAPDGGVVVAGRGAGRFTTEQGAQAAEADIAAVRFTDTGEVAWSRMFGGLGDPAAFGNGDDPDAVAFDPRTGQIAIMGNTTGSYASVDIDGGASGPADAEGSPDHAGTGPGLVLRLDAASGDLLRSRQFETNGRDNVTGGTVGPDGAVSAIGNLDALANALPGQPPIPISGGGAAFTVTYDGEGSPAWTRADTPATGDASAAGIATTAGGLRLVAGDDRPAVLVYDPAGRLLAEFDEVVLSRAETGFGSGATSAIATGDGAVYLAGSSNTAWAGPALGETDGWLARLELRASMPETPDFDLLDLPSAAQIAALYVGYFGRAPYADGLDFWEDDYATNREDGKPVGEILRGQAESFRFSPEATALYDVIDSERSGKPDRGAVTDFVTDVYRNLFDRDPTDRGLTFWTDTIEAQLGAGEPIGDAIVDIIAGAQNGGRVDTDGDGAPDTAVNDAATLLNKVDAGLDHGRRIDAPDTGPSPGDLTAARALRATRTPSSIQTSPFSMVNSACMSSRSVARISSVWALISAKAFGASSSSEGPRRSRSRNSASAPRCSASRPWLWLR